MNFIIMFMGSPEYIRNPYIRAKMVEVLKCWVPRTSGSEATRTLFEGHRLSLEYFVKYLLKLYFDIELTGVHTQAEEEKLHKQQSENLKAQYKKFELIEKVHEDGTANRLGSLYNSHISDA